MSEPTGPLRKASAMSSAADPESRSGIPPLPFFRTLPLPFSVSLSVSLPLSLESLILVPPSLEIFAESSKLVDSELILKFDEFVFISVFEACGVNIVWGMFLSKVRARVSYISSAVFRE
jgi:hypothetical protein